MKNPKGAQFLATPGPTPPVPRGFTVAPVSNSPWKALAADPTPVPELKPSEMDPLQRRLYEIRQKVLSGQKTTIQDDMLLKKLLEK